MQNNSGERSKHYGFVNGKIAPVTGASNSIGRAIAERVAHDGATVVANGKSADKAKPALRLKTARPRDPGVMSQVPEVRRLMRETVWQFGHSIS